MNESGACLLLVACRGLIAASSVTLLHSGWKLVVTVVLPISSQLLLGGSWSTIAPVAGCFVGHTGHILARTDSFKVLYVDIATTSLHFQWRTQKSDLTAPAQDCCRPG